MMRCASTSFAITPTVRWLAILALPGCLSWSRVFWWPHLSRDATTSVLSCGLCQRNKPRSGKAAGLLQQLLPIPAAPWDSVSLDFVVSLPKTEGGYDAVIVFVDRLTKWCTGTHDLALHGRACRTFVL
jgi:hypothetical protein